MRAGSLDRRVTLRRPVTTDNAYGEPAPAWTDVATVWAKVVQGAAGEVMARGVAARVDVLFRIRWRTDVTTAWRIVHGADTYDIQSIAEVGRREGLEILATIFRGA